MTVKDALDLAHHNLLMENGSLFVLNALNSLVDSTQDFTDSLYVNNEQRERIIRLQNEIREHTLVFMKDEIQTKQQQQQQHEGEPTPADGEHQAEVSGKPNERTQFKVAPILNDCDVLKKLLQAQTMQLANSLFRENQDATLLNCIKSHSMSNHYDLLIETLDKFKEYSDHVLEVNH